MTLRFTPLALAALLVLGTGCGEGGGTSSNISDLEGMDPFDQIAYAFGFEAAQGLKSDSASFKFFDYATFEDGFNDGLAGDSSKIGYLFGFELGNRIGRDTTTNLNTNVFLAAFREGLDSDSSRISDEDLQRISGIVQDSLQMRQLRAAALTDTSAARRLTQIAEGKASAARFLSEIEGRDGVSKTETGLLFTVQEEGTGASPNAEDVVVVNYKGTLADGTEFDSGEEATFALQAVAPGFREGVEAMKVGGKRTIYLPPNLGYGSQGTPGGPIPPNAALVFEIELLDIMSTGEAGQPLPQGAQ